MFFQDLRQRHLPRLTHLTYLAHLTHLPRRKAVVATVAVLLLTGGAAGGAAAVADGAEQGSYRSTVLSVEPEVDGLSVEVDAGSGRVVMTNDGDLTVVVLGYQDEPYLRIGPDGVEQNEESVTAALVGGADLRSLEVRSGAVRWVRVSQDARAQWLDLRTRWSTDLAPPNVAEAPGSAHRVSEWALPLMVDGAPTLVRGAIDWTGPAGPPWLLLLGALALVLIVAATLWGLRRRSRGVPPPSPSPPSPHRRRSRRLEEARR